MEKELLLEKRIQELAALADRRGCVTFTDFLNLNEQNILHQTLQKFSWIKGETFGGYEGAERCMVAFLPETLYEQDWKYPITCIRIELPGKRFAETLSHRDVLGALMNLGIDRSRTGDIAITEEEICLFCHTMLAETVCRELTRIRHTSVQCTVCEMEGFTWQPKTETVRGSIASVRLDTLMALAFQSSRSSLMSLIGEGRVFVNGKLITTNAYTPGPGDLISVRGLGKFRYLDVTGKTKKGRCMAEIERFI